MKVLMISGDKNMLTPDTEAHRRLELQRSQVEQLDLFVWPRVHTLRTILKATKTTHYDVITAQDPFWRGHLAWHLSKRNHARFNIQVHTDLSAYSFLRRRWARLHLRRAHSIRVVSERIKEQVLSMKVHAKISVLPVFVDVTPFRHLSPIPHPRKTILWIGRFEAEKDPVHAIEVLTQVRSYGIDVKLVLLGDGSLGEELRRLTKGLPVEFPGWQDPKPFLQVADVVLSTSQHESYGASMVEALAAGLPVVAPDVGIAKEAGAVVVDRSKLAEAIIKTLQDDAHGRLLLYMPNKKEWSENWKQTL